MEERTSVVNVTPPWRKTFDFQMMQEDITFGQECFRKAILVVGLFFNCTVLVSCSLQLRYPRGTFSGLSFRFSNASFSFNAHSNWPSFLIKINWPVKFSLYLRQSSIPFSYSSFQWPHLTATWLSSAMNGTRKASLIVESSLRHSLLQNLQWIQNSHPLIQQYLSNYHQQSVTVKFVNSWSGNSNFGNRPTLSSKHFIDFLFRVVKSPRDLQLLLIGSIGTMVSLVQLPQLSWLIYFLFAVSSDTFFLYLKAVELNFPDNSINTSCSGLNISLSYWSPLDCIFSQKIRWCGAKTSPGKYFRCIRGTFSRCSE